MPLAIPVLGRACPLHGPDELPALRADPAGQSWYLHSQGTLVSDQRTSFYFSETTLGHSNSLRLFKVLAILEFHSCFGYLFGERFQVAGMG